MPIRDADLSAVTTQCEVAEFLLAECEAGCEAGIEVEVACRLMLSLNSGQAMATEDLDLASYALARVLARWTACGEDARRKLGQEFEVERSGMARAHLDLIVNEFPHAFPKEPVERCVACGITSLLRCANRLLSSAESEAGPRKGAFDETPT